MKDIFLPVNAQTLLDASLMFGGFVILLFLASIFLPGEDREGMPDKTGMRRPYKLSGLILFFATHLVLATGTLVFDWSLTPVLTHFWSLFIVANVFSIGATAWLVWRGRSRLGDRIERDSKLPPLLHDIWFGTELHPTLFGVDIKMFAYHPSLIGLGVVNVAFAYRQLELYGDITPQMGLFVVFWWAYLFTHYIKEDFMLSTWDIMAEKFGFMLVWGDLVYVPFFYSIAGWYLIDDTTPWGLTAVLVLGGLHVLGHWIFRGANWQKHAYKRDPDTLIWGKAVETIKDTGDSGRELLVSGWWGFGRKINYTGEIIVYLSFALTTGFQSFVPYILPISLVILLVQRAGRDDKRCRAKYGELWQRYCDRVRFKMVPLLY